MMTKILSVLARSRKALIGGVVAYVGAYALKHGISLEDSAVNVLTAVLTLVSVWLVPNRPAV
jgi:hypothetical protein